MATPPSSRGSSLDHTFRPLTPDSHASSKQPAASMSIPRSECLRNALEARRAQNTPAQTMPKPTPTSKPAPRSAAPPPLAIQTPAASPDAFDEFDLPDELMTPESPIRRRRPQDKDGTPPRGKTNLELSAEVEKLRDELFKQNIRVELLKKSNHELQAKWVLAKEEIDQLKPLEEENYELRMDNKKLTEKLAGVQDDIDHIDDIHDELDKLDLEKKAAEDANEALKTEVVNLTSLYEETVTNAQETEEALREGVEMITSLEGEKVCLYKEVDDLKTENSLLKKEVDHLKTRVAAIESQQMDGSEYPHRVHSIDENGPATSHDDSDYYSQPATPHADADRDAHSIRSISSARSKQFIELTKKRTRSTRSLSKRLSAASLRATSVVSAVQVPEFPDVPEEYSQVTPRIVDARFRERRYRQGSGAEQVVARSDAEMRRPATVAPVQLHQPSGFRSSVPTLSAAGTCPVTPPRMSSRRAHTTSDDRVHVPLSDGTFDCRTSSVAFGGQKKEKQEQVLTAWTSVNPRTSRVSMLTSPRIDQPDKERWWKDTENVRPLRARATTRTLRADFCSDDGELGSETFAIRTEGVRTNPTTPATEKPEQDFLFNPRENEEQFMRKAKTRLKGSIRR